MTTLSGAFATSGVVLVISAQSKTTGCSASEVVDAAVSVSMAEVRARGRKRVRWVGQVGQVGRAGRSASIGVLQLPGFRASGC